MKTQEQDELLQAPKARFEKNMHRHEGIAWVEVRYEDFQLGQDAT